MSQTHQTPYEKIGGDPVVRKLAETFYRLMDSPEAKDIRALHPAEIATSQEKFYLFFTGWLGGPAWYQEKYGHPKLRARHLPFPIGKKERDQWMVCMVNAFEEVGIAEPLRSELLYGLLTLADHMRNKTEA